MKVFISWSGTKSKAVAEALREWLPNVIQRIEPWMSDADIEKGARWSRDISSVLEDVRVGIICLTRDNLEAPWILFETGALAKTVKKTWVWTLLVDLKDSDLPGNSPLLQFQFTKLQKEDFRKLIHTINKAAGGRVIEQSRLDKIFNKFWPDLETKLKELPSEAPASPLRSQKEKVDEILELCRALMRFELMPSLEDYLQSFPSGMTPEMIASYPAEVLPATASSGLWGAAKHLLGLTQNPDLPNPKVTSLKRVKSSRPARQALKPKARH